MNKAVRSLGGPLAVIAAVVVIDQLTKHWAINELRGGRVIDVAWTLRLKLAYNTGMAFSQGKGLGPVIGVVGLVAVVVLLVVVAGNQHRAAHVPIGLAIGGALGNIVDRMFRGDAWFRGGVVDFIDFQWWPVFNVADAAIVVGGLVIVVGSLFERDELAPVASSTAASSGEQTADD